MSDTRIPIAPVSTGSTRINSVNIMNIAQGNKYIIPSPIPGHLMLDIVV